MNSATWGRKVPDAASAPLVGVVIVNYGDPAVMRTHALAADLTEVPAVVVVVDNYSTAHARAAVEALCADCGLELVPLPTNGGFGAGVNAGVRRALELGAEVLLVLNPDAAADTATVAALRDDVVANPDTLVSPVVRHPDGRPWFAGAELSLLSGRTRRSGVLQGGLLQPWLTGACLMAHQDAWTAAGGFDETYFLYWEDVDLSLRWSTIGGRLRVRHDLSVLHAVGKTQQDAGKSLTYYQYNCRNRLVFASKHLKPLRTLRWVLTSPSYAREVLSRGGPHPLLESRQPVWAAMRGTASGFVVVLTSWLRSGIARPSARNRSARLE